MTGGRIFNDATSTCSTCSAFTGLVK